MKNIFIKNKKIATSVFASSFFLLLLPKICRADAVNQALGLIAKAISAVCGLFLQKVISLVVSFAQYDNYLRNTEVTKAWIIVRDFCNMFFILILLFIAFAVMLRIESYNIKKSLPKLLIMAVLINFSKTICGILIDFSQVIMLTFVSAFADAPGNFHALLQIDKFLKAVGQSTLPLEKAVPLYMAAIVFMIVSLVVMLAILIIFVMRIIMFWIYIVLSPLAFMLSAFPAGQKYASQYWGEFTRYLINGPVLAFFIWMSLSVLAGLNLDEFETEYGEASLGILEGNSMTSFIMAIGMLVGGLTISSQIGGIGASWGANTVSNLKNRGLSMAKGGVGAVGGLGKDIAFTTGRKLDVAQMKVQQGLFGKGGKEYFAKSLNPFQMKKGWDASRAEALKKYETGEETQTPPSEVYHDIVNKYFNLNQLKTITKSKKDIDRDKVAASRLKFNADRLETRAKNAGLTEEEREAESEKYKKDKEKMKQEYIDNAPLDKKTQKEKEDYANEQLAKDNFFLESPEKVDVQALKKQAEEKRKQAETLEDPRRFEGFGSKKAAQIVSSEYKYSKLGAEEQQDKAVSELKRQTGGESGAIIEQMLESFDKGETSRVVGALKLLTMNNDMNDALKDKRVISLMTKNNGLLDKLVKNNSVKGLDSSNEAGIKALKEDFKNNPVTAANAQALMQSMFRELGLNDNMSAKISSAIGEIGVEKGNTLTYAMAKADEVRGGHTFQDMAFKDGRLHTSEGRKQAGVGKLNTFEAQAWARNLHPNSWFSETSDGKAGFITEEGEELLRNVNASQLGQINRLRTDNYKAAKNPKVMEQLKKLADTVEKEGNKKQADLIRYFGGYIKTKMKGDSLKDEEDMIKALNEE